MATAQLAAVSYLARYSGQTHILYASQLRRWFAWCESKGLDPLVGIQRAHIELYIRHLGDCGLMDSSVTTMMHVLRGFFRFAHINGLIPSDPAVYARLPKIHQDESRTQGLHRLELIRFLKVAQTITVHHGALAYLLGINALRALRRPPSESRPTAKSCVATGSFTWSGRATTRHHAHHRPGAASAAGVPRLTDRWDAGAAAELGQPGRPARCVPDGRKDREGREDPAAHQPALSAPRSYHQRTRCRRPAPRCSDPCSSC
jgi:hypothetical protein